MAAAAGNSGAAVGGGVAAGAAPMPLTGSQEFAQMILRDPGITQPAVGASVTATAAAAIGAVPPATLLGATGPHTFASTSGGIGSGAYVTGGQHGVQVPGSSAPLSASAAAAAAATVASAGTAPAPKKFFFRRRTGRLDWRKLAKVDLQRVVIDVDIAALQDNVEHITFADVGEEVETWTNDNIIFLLRFSQLIIEYLLHVQNYLLTTVTHKEGVVSALTRDLTSAHMAVERAAGDERLLKRELHHMKKMLHAYQKSVAAGAGAANTAGATAAAVAAAVSNAIVFQPHPCPHCTVQFKSEAYLRSHLARRHPNLPQTFTAPSQQQTIGGGGGKAGVSAGPTSDFKEPEKPQQQQQPTSSSLLFTSSAEKDQRQRELLVNDLRNVLNEMESRLLTGFSRDTITRITDSVAGTIQRTVAAAFAEQRGGGAASTGTATANSTAGGGGGSGVTNAQPMHAHMFVSPGAARSLAGPLLVDADDGSDLKSRAAAFVASGGSDAAAAQQHLDATDRLLKAQLADLNERVRRNVESVVTARVAEVLAELKALKDGSGVRVAGGGGAGGADAAALAAAQADVTARDATIATLRADIARYQAAAKESAPSAERVITLERENARLSADLALAEQAKRDLTAQLAVAKAAAANASSDALAAATKQQADLRAAQQAAAAVAAQAKQAEQVAAAVAAGQSAAAAASAAAATAAAAASAASAERDARLRKSQELLRMDGAFPVSSAYPFVRAKFDHGSRVLRDRLHDMTQVVDSASTPDRARQLRAQIVDGYDATQLATKTQQVDRLVESFVAQYYRADRPVPLVLDSVVDRPAGLAAVPAGDSVRRSQERKHLQQQHRAGSAAVVAAGGAAPTAASASAGASASASAGAAGGAGGASQAGRRPVALASGGARAPANRDDDDDEFDRPGGGGAAGGGGGVRDSWDALRVSSDSVTALPASSASASASAKADPDDDPVKRAERENALRALEKRRDEAKKREAAAAAAAAAASASAPAPMASATPAGMPSMGSMASMAGASSSSSSSSAAGKPPVATKKKPKVAADDDDWDAQLDDISDDEGGSYGSKHSSKKSPAVGAASDTKIETIPDAAPADRKQPASMATASSSSGSAEPGAPGSSSSGLPLKRVGSSGGGGGGASMAGGVKSGWGGSSSSGGMGMPGSMSGAASSPSGGFMSGGGGSSSSSGLVGGDDKPRLMGFGAQKRAFQRPTGIARTPSGSSGSLNPGGAAADVHEVTSIDAVEPAGVGAGVGADTSITSTPPVQKAKVRTFHKPMYSGSSGAPSSPAHAMKPDDDDLDVHDL